MKVELKRDWFDPTSTRRRRGVVEVPDEFRDLLPKDAVVVDEATPIRRASDGLRQNLPSKPKAAVKAAGKSAMVKAKDDE